MEHELSRRPDGQWQPGIDNSRSHSTKPWNYWWGGKDSNAVERAAGDEFLVCPRIVPTAQATRKRLARAVSFLVGDTMKSTVRVGLLAFTAATGFALSGCSSSAQPGQLPHASDGTNLQACASGNCVVQVSASAQIPLPASARVTGLQVQSISADSVIIIGRDVGRSFGGSCSGNCHRSTSGGNFQMTLGQRGSATENNLSISMNGTDGKSAVLRIAPNPRSRTTNAVVAFLDAGTGR